jgi:hypothetical protein
VIVGEAVLLGQRLPLGDKETDPEAVALLAPDLVCDAQPLPLLLPEWLRVGMGEADMLRVPEVQALKDLPWVVDIVLHWLWLSEAEVHTLTVTVREGLRVMEGEAEKLGLMVGEALLLWLRE